MIVTAHSSLPTTKELEQKRFIQVANESRMIVLKFDLFSKLYLKHLYNYFSGLPDSNFTYPVVFKALPNHYNSDNFTRDKQMDQS